MNVNAYRKSKGLTQAQFAALLTENGFPATQGLVSQWENGTTTLTGDWCRNIEIATRGECTRVANRPDMFGVLAVPA